MTTSNKGNITKRSDKTSPLTHDELDLNFDELGNVIDDAGANENALQTHENASDPHPQYALMDELSIDYAAGIEITQYNQIVRDPSSGEFWRVSGSETLPYTLTGAGVPEGGALVSVGDAALRQDLVQPVATFNNVADMKAASGLDVGRKCRTLGYYAPGDGGRNAYEIVAAATGTDDGGSFIDLVGSGLQAKGLFGDVIDVRQFGVIEDGVTDNYSALINAISYPKNKTLVGSGEVIAFNSFITANLSNHITLKNLNIKFESLEHKYYALRIKTTKDITFTNFHADGSELTNKVVRVDPNHSECSVYCFNSMFKNGLETDLGGGYAAGLQVGPENSAQTFKLFESVGFKAENITSTKEYTGTLTSAGRGLQVFNSREATVREFDVREIGPVEDGDGIVFSAATDEQRANARLVIENGYGLNCAKRTIKSQIANTYVNNVTVERTKQYTGSENHTLYDISLQRGGVVDGVLAKYAPGCLPRAPVAVAFSDISKVENAKGHVSNIVVQGENATDVLPHVVSITSEGTFTNKNVVINTITCGILVDAVVRFYTSEGVGTIDWQFDDVSIGNISAELNAGNPDAAVVELSRGSGSYNKVRADLHNCYIRGVVPFKVSFLNPAPGTTSILGFSLRSSSNNPNMGELRNILKKSMSPTVCYSEFAPQASTFSKTFRFDSPYASAKVTVFTGNARDILKDKAYTEGYLFASTGDTFFRETVAGTKGSVQVGFVSINPMIGDTGFTIEKTAGSVSASAYIYIVIESPDAVYEA